MSQPGNAREEGSPYIGLRPFTGADSHLYFGRDGEALAVVRRLRKCRFLVVTGESGCGKSSLIQAGVIPALHRGAMDGAGSSWRVATMRPGEDPIGRLGRTIAGALAEDEVPHAALQAEGEMIETVLRSGSRGLVEAGRQWQVRKRQPVGAGFDVYRQGPAQQLLVLVDQFEELFRFKGSGAANSDEEARKFVKLLLTATGDEDTGIYCILTMRSDFLGECPQFAGLPEAINRGEFLLSRMTRDELRQAITGPAAVAGVPVAPQLTNEVLNQVGDEPGRLPVLQHALMRAWQEWREDHKAGEPIGVRHFLDAGGMEHALSNHAGETLGQLSEVQRRTAERVFRALTQLDLGGRAIRRPTALGTLAEICAAEPAEVESVVRHFAAPGRNFLTAGGEEYSSATIVDLSHESLIQQWDKLGEWMRLEYQDAELYRDLARDAALHRKGERGLWRDPELALGLQWRRQRPPNPKWAERYAPGFTEAMAFLQASADAWARERNLRRGLIGGIAAVLLLAAVALVLWQKARADYEHLQAESLKSEKVKLEERIRALTTQNPELGVEAQRLRDENRTLQWEILQVQAGSARLEQEIGELRSDATDFRLQIARLLKRVSELETQIQAIRAEIVEAEKTSADLKAEVAKLASQVAQLRTRNQELRTAALALGLIPIEIATTSADMAMMPPLAEMTKSLPLSSVSTMAVRADDTLKRLRFELDQALLENLRFKKTIEELRLQNEQLRAQEMQERTRNATLTAERDRLRHDKDALQTQVRDLQGRQAEGEATLAALRNRRRDLADEANRFALSQTRLRSEINALESENGTLEAVIAQRRRDR